MAVKWTAEQQKVIDTRDRNLLVSAAAGSGKTAVLVERILAADPASPCTDQHDPWLLLVCDKKLFSDDRS